MPSRFTRTLLAGAVLLLSACMSQPGAVPSPEPPVLDGTEWTVTKIKGADTVADSQPTIAFEDGKVSGTPGCNRFFGSYTQDGAKLEFGMMGTTEMACLDEASASRRRHSSRPWARSPASAQPTPPSNSQAPTVRRSSP